MPEDGINGSVFGRKTKPHTEETKAKIKAARAGQKPTMLGKKHSEETKQKIQLAIKAKGPRSEETKLKLSYANKGKKLSEETKQKIGISSTGRKCPKSLEHRKKLSDANKGKKLSTETKTKISESIKRLKKLQRETPI